MIGHYFYRDSVDGDCDFIKPDGERCGGKSEEHVAKNCYACSHSYMEPHSDLICGHREAGVFGKTIRKQPLEFCPEYIHFQQHPRRNPDGTLKGVRK